MEENKSFITYDENWQSVSRAEYPNISEPEAEDAEPTDKKPKKQKPMITKQYLLTFQLIACLLIAAAAFILKTTGGELYESAREWYYSQLGASAVFDGSGGFDIKSLLNISTPDEAENK